MSGPARAEHGSTRAAFFVAGFAMAAWAPLVPYAKDRLDLNDATLGLLLLCLGAGSIATMPLAGALAARFGCRRVIWAAAAVTCLALPLLAGAGHTALLAGALAAFGAGVGTVDVVINIQAVIVERAAGRPVMSGFHGFFSAGGIAGAAGVGGVLWATGSPLLASLGVVAVVAATLAVFGGALLPHGGHRSGPAFAWPRGVVLLIGGLCFVCFLAEGAMLDWSALILTTLHGMDPSRAGAGYATFSVAMTAGRFFGDRVVPALGSRRVLVAGGGCAACGLALCVLAPGWSGALAGFALVGLGAANIVPALYSALGRQTAMPANLAIGAVSTIGYAGILAGPAAIGFVAHALGLAAAFLGLAVAVLVIPACAGVVAPGRPAKAR